jgi:sugar lactone lactonase YvrE
MKIPALPAALAAILAFQVLPPAHANGTAPPIPPAINYQGVLSNPDGSPVNGVRSMRVKIYDAPTGGKLVYSEDIGNVTVQNGAYSFAFGNAGTGVASALTGNDHLALEVNGAEGAPRTRLLAVPYAVRSLDTQEIRKELVALGVLPVFEKNVQVSTFAGTGNPYSLFRLPLALAVNDAGSVFFFGDSLNQHYQPYYLARVNSSGDLDYLSRNGTFERSGNFSVSMMDFFTPIGLAFDRGGNLYIAERDKRRVVKISSSGNFSVFSGNGTSGLADGPPDTAMFLGPSALAVDKSDNIYVADYGWGHMSRIRKITPGGIASTIAGNGTQGFADGLPANAMFDSPSGIAVDGDGNIFVADKNNHRIRKITPGGMVSTLAGGGTAAYADGLGTKALFNSPTGIATDAAGNVYVADTNNHRIRKITPDGTVSTLAGFGSQGFSDGTGIYAAFYGPTGIALDANGNIFVADHGNHRIRKITVSD